MTGLRDSRFLLALGGGGGGGGVPLPNPIPDDTALPNWGDSSDGSALYQSGLDLMTIRGNDRGDATGSAGVGMVTEDGAAGPSGPQLFETGDAAAGFTAGTIFMRTGLSLAADGQRGTVAFGQTLTAADLGVQAVAPEFRERASARMRGIDFTPNQVHLETRFEEGGLPITGGAAAAYPDNINFFASEAPGPGAPTTSSFNANGYFIGTSGAAIGDSGMVQANTTPPARWAGVDLDLFQEVTVHMGFRTPALIADTRKEAGFKQDPLADYGVDNGNGGPAMFVRHDPAAAVPADWALVTDIDGASGVVSSTGVTVLADQDYLFTWVTDSAANLLFFVDGVLTNSVAMGAVTGPVGRPYTGISNNVNTGGITGLSGVRWSLDYESL